MKDWSPRPFPVTTINPKSFLKNSPSGTIGNGKSGSRSGKSDLAAASTTLGGVQNLAPSSTGPIAGEGGNPEFTQGDALGGTGKGSGKGTGEGVEFGSFDLGSPEVSGGLDRGDSAENHQSIPQPDSDLLRTSAALQSPSRRSGQLYMDNFLSRVVATVQMTKSTAGSPVLESCVSVVIHSMVFPVPITEDRRRCFIPSYSRRVPEAAERSRLTENLRSSTVPIHGKCLSGRRPSSGSNTRSIRVDPPPR